MSKARGEQFFFAAFYFEMLGRNFGGLRCARQRTGQDEIRPRFDSGKERADFAHLFFAPLGQRPFIVGLFPVRPVCFAMSKKIKVHVNLMGGFTGCTTSSDGFGGQFATDACRQERHSDYARVQLLPEANSTFSCYRRLV